MIVGELRHGQLTIIDRLRETVRLSEGLDETGDITAAARARAIDCLSRFGERLRDMQAASVRAAGTSTLRRAKDSRQFCRAAEKALGHPIEVISGREEARLIYIGVVHSTPANDGLRLVLDIGGGSTELILGQGAQPKALESLHMGCVVMTERHFPGGQLTREAFDKARLAIRLKLRPIKAFFRDSAEISPIGTSGTILSTARVARELGIIDAALTLDAVEQLIERVIDCGHIADLSMPGLSERRAQVWPGGLTILAELLHVLRLDQLATSDGSLREGLLYDFIGRLHHEDARERSVRAFALRYNVDQDQAARVADTAGRLLAECAAVWKLDSDLAGKALDWSARLHEMGLDISHVGFDRHGAYIAENADLPGFPHVEQKLLAFMIASQRRQIDIARCKGLPGSWQAKAVRLAILLRLSVLLNRNRSREALPEISINARQKSLHLKFPTGWLDDNPLTVADLERETGYLEQAGFELTFE